MKQLNEHQRAFDRFGRLLPKLFVPRDALVGASQSFRRLGSVRLVLLHVVAHHGDTTGTSSRSFTRPVVDKLEVS